jgi:hypothetical protein
MKRTMMLAVVVLGATLGGCGSDDASGDGDLTDAQRAAAALAVSDAAERGITLDQECVDDVAAQLSDEDAQKIAAEDGTPLSAGAEELGAELLRCAPQDALVDLFIQGLAEGGDEVDEACARRQLEDVDIAELVAQTQSGNPPVAVLEALIECFPTP